MIENKHYDDQLTAEIIGACIDVHKELGPGLLESVYEEALCLELDIRGINYERQHLLPINYKGQQLAAKFKADVLVENEVLLELKSIKNFDDIHQAQIIHYLRISNLKRGLLINFNVKYLKNGIKRFVI